MAKETGTQPAGTDDSSQQPTQKTTPTRREKHAIDEEDHIKKRDSLSKDERKK